MAMAASAVPACTVTGTRQGPRTGPKAGSARASLLLRGHQNSSTSRIASQTQALLGDSAPRLHAVQVHRTDSSAQGNRSSRRSSKGLNSNTTGLRNSHNHSHNHSSSYSFRNSKSSCISVRRREDRRRGGLECRASAGGTEAEKKVYPGVYGPWSVETSDKVEVLLYRAGLNVVSLSLFLCSLPALLSPSLSDPSSPSPLSPLLTLLSSPLPQTLLFWTGTSALGLSLVLIHIYVTPIKRTLQGLWAGGALGALALSYGIAASAPASADLAGADVAGASVAVSLVRYVVEHPAGVWAVGPMFAALTGLVFKEGLCYGKLEAAVLFFIIPSLLLGHLSGALGPDVERPLLGAWVLLSLIFSLRKFTQPLKDDIGDKSVFLFQALPREEQEKLLAGLQGREDRQ